MKRGKTTQFQTLAPLIIGFLLAGCAAHTPSPAPLTTPASSVVAPSAEATHTPTPVQTTSPVSHPTPTSANYESTPEATLTPYPYGVVYAYPASDWTEADRQAIREHLEYLQELGVNTIVQVFSSRLIGAGREKDWLILLDEAERINMRVIARLWPPDDWNGRDFDFQTIKSFLTIVQDHPALLAYMGLHEPLEQFDSDQLQRFYAGVKKIAPELAIANYMGNMAWFEESPRFPNRDFGTGICDICIVWYYPARYLHGEPALEEDLVRETLQENRKLVDERAPETQLWFLGQTYTQHAHRRQLRMPTPEEMETIYAIAEEEGADGFLWYPWAHGNYDQMLSDPDMEPQRQAVRRIYENHILQKSTP
ncbi:MAG: hypothetical protein SWK90_10950 [Chloroflexota bacterium]|nr:hypothetical protein [Chloroflexota bacterium]